MSTIYYAFHCNYKPVNWNCCFYPGVLWSFIVIDPLIILGYSDILQKKHAIKRNFPVISQLRYLLEKVRPEIM